MSAPQRFTLRATTLTLGILVLAIAPSWAGEVHYTNFANIVGLETGWEIDSLRVKLDEAQAPFVNAHEEDKDIVPCPPAPQPCFHQVRITTPCQSTNGGYVLDPSHSGVKLHQAAFLSAFTAGKKVRLILSGCLFTSPVIVGVNVGAPVY
jgi:hypothetical protein